MLTDQEIKLLVYEYIGVQNGYLGDFSYKTHREFYRTYCNLNINPDSIEGTTRKRFITILENANAVVQAKIIKGVLTKYPISFFLSNTQEEKIKIRSKLENIVMRLEKEAVSPLFQPSRHTQIENINQQSKIKMPKKLQIFISSTYLDLKEERQAAVEAILRNNHIPAGMELFQAGSKSQLEIIRNWIKESDIYMLILGGRYGSIEPESGLSYTELEYRFAIEMNIPIFGIILSDSFLHQKQSESPSLPVFENQEKEKMQTFKSLVMSKMIREVDNVHQLSSEVGYSIRSLEQDQNYNFRGWIRAETNINTHNIQNVQSENEKIFKNHNLSEIEIKLLSCILGNQMTPDESVSAFRVKEDMRKNGITEAATNLNVRKLLYKGFIEIIEEENSFNGESFTAYQITKQGDTWILQNEKHIYNILL